MHFFTVIFFFGMKKIGSEINLTRNDTLKYIHVYITDLSGKNLISRWKKYGYFKVVHSLSHILILLQELNYFLEKADMDWRK